MAVIWGTNYSIVKYALRRARSPGVQRREDDARIGDLPRDHRRAPEPAGAAWGRWRTGFLRQHPAHVGAAHPQRLVGARRARADRTLRLSGTASSAGSALTSVANSSLMLAATPVVIALLSAALGLDRISRLHWIGAALSMAGIYYVVGDGLSVGSDSIAGDVLMLVAVSCWAIYTLGATRLMRRHSPVGVTGLSMAIGTALYVPAVWSHLRSTQWTAVSASDLGGARLLGAVRTRGRLHHLVRRGAPDRQCPYGGVLQCHPVSGDAHSRRVPGRAARGPEASGGSGGPCWRGPDPRRQLATGQP